MWDAPTQQIQFFKLGKVEISNLGYMELRALTQAVSFQNPHQLSRGQNIVSCTSKELQQHSFQCYRATVLLQNSNTNASLFNNSNTIFVTSSKKSIGNQIATPFFCTQAFLATEAI
jgi:hypothetical protein